jgi:hypothetical protein
MNYEEPLPPDGATSFLHRSERGELAVWLAAPSVLVWKYRGYSDASYLPFIAMAYERTLARLAGRTAMFVDCELQTGYDSNFRRGLVDWGKRMNPFPSTYCLFVKSRLVAMGIAIARLALGGTAQHVEVVTTRDAYRAKLEGAVRKALADATINARSDESNDQSLPSSEGGSGGR